MLSWLDEAGAAFAGYLCHTQSMVTLKMEEVACSTRMVFVKLDDQGQPIPIDERLRTLIDQSRAGFTPPG